MTDLNGFDAPVGLLPPDQEPSWRGSPAREARSHGDWTDLISGSFVPLTARPVGDQPVRGRLHTIQRGPIGLARIEGSAQRVVRGRRELAGSSDRVVYFNVQLTGLGHVRTRLGDTRTGVGSAVIVPSFEAFELGFAQPFTQLCATLQADWLADRLEMPLGLLAARQADLTRGVGRVVRAALGAVMEAESPEECEVCADLFVRSLVDTVARPGPLAGREVGPGSLIDGIRRLISRRMGEADLTPVVAARELGCSLSTLHLHCQKAGSGFGTMLAEARLNAAARALRTSVPARGRVAMVALSCGFSDPSHFSRRFRARFGVAPGHYR